MKRGLLILAPIIVLAVYMSRPAVAPAQQEITTPPVGVQTPAEEKVEEVSLSVSPTHPIQGEPLLITVEGISSTSTIRTLKFKNEAMPVFVSNGKPRGLFGIDLRFPPGTYPITLALSDGRVIQENIVVGERKMARAPLGIPEELGGNTPESEQELVNSLEQEAKIINAIKTSEEKLWNGTFRFPLAGPITVTDVYGYSRETGASTIAHKGTDFRALVGTPVYAINDGQVAYTGYLRNYGNVIAVDHGTKLLSIYMHLSKVSPSLGETVKKGDVVGLSGETGYVLGPHLHLTIRINNISIDPMKFMDLLGA